MTISESLRTIIFPFGPNNINKNIIILKEFKEPEFSNVHFSDSHENKAFTLDSFELAKLLLEAENRTPNYFNEGDRD